jgi:hypothetical protein
MGNILNIGEKVIMFKVDCYESGRVNHGKTFTENPYIEVKVVKRDNIWSNNVYTVVDQEGNEYCGTHGYNKEIGKICLLRKSDYIEALKRSAYYLFFDEYKKLGHRINKLCNHLFVKLREGYTVPGFHSSDYEYEEPIIYCVHCGLTNWYRGMSFLVATRSMTLKNETYRDYVRTYCPSNVRFDKGDTSWIPFISKEAYFFHDPGKRYLEAKKLKPYAKNEEIFQTMKEIDLKEKEEIYEKAKEKEEKEKTKKKGTKK